MGVQDVRAAAEARRAGKKKSADKEKGDEGQENQPQTPSVDDNEADETNE